MTNGLHSHSTVGKDHRYPHQWGACWSAARFLLARDVGTVGLALWTFASATAAISGIAAIQDMVPHEDRGVGMALVAFCNTLLGLGFGSTLVAVATERVYADPMSVGLSIATIVFPAGVMAVVLFFQSGRTVIKET